jgi:hypothetical protein
MDFTKNDAHKAKPIIAKDESFICFFLGNFCHVVAMYKGTIPKTRYPKGIESVLEIALAMLVMNKRSFH